MTHRRLPGAEPAAVSELFPDALVVRCRAGDAQALDAFFRAYVKRVERVLGRLVGPTPDLDDLVQSTFIEAMTAFPRFRGEASVATWVTRIAVHVAHRQLRRGVRRTLPLELLPDEAEPRDDSEPDRLPDRKEVARRLHALLDRIAPKKRVAFLLFTLDGYSLAEVAALTGASRMAVKSRVWFARRELLALAKEDEVLRDLAGALVEGKS